ncbi:MAG: DUF2357 domain-containing protein [Anaerolineales bacterium]|nr:DUF2357 domain-containing protein [Anaerolineales bacterium]
MLATQRLCREPKAVPISELAGQRIRAADWRFTLAWDEGSYPRRLLVDDSPLREVDRPGTPGADAWPFHLPPTVREMVRIEAEAFSGERCVGIIDTIAGFQMPPEHLQLMLGWFQFYRDIAVSFGGEITSLDLIDDIFSLFDDTLAPDVIEDDIPPKVRTELSGLFDQVLKAPLRRLIDEQCLVDPGEIQRISPATVDHFIRHPETWHRRARLRPRPARLLDDRVDEDYDVYENRFVLHFLESLRVRLQGLMSRDRLAAYERELYLDEAIRRANLSVFSYRVEDFDRLRDQSHELRRNWVDLEHFHNTVLQVQSAPTFDKVRPLSGSPRANTALLMHPVYGRLYQIYEEIEQASYNHDRLQRLAEVKCADFHGAYFGYCVLMLLRAFKQAHFDVDSQAPFPIWRGDAGVPLRSGSPGQAAAIELRHRDRPNVRVKVSLPPSEGDSVDGGIQLEFSHQDSRSMVWLFPDPSWWGGRDLSLEEKASELRGLYERLLELNSNPHGPDGSKLARRNVRRRDREAEASAASIRHTVLLLHPTATGDFDERLPYADLRLLLNQGDNFASDEDYYRYGDYRVGALPIYIGQSIHATVAGVSTPDAERSNLRRFQRLIRIQLFHIGLEDLCWNCFQTATVTAQADRYKYYACRNSNCGLRWGEITCGHCHKRVVKMKPASNAGTMREFTSYHAENAVSAIGFAEALEGGLAVSSVCESPDHASNFWGICPYCGHCEKEVAAQHCLRCRSRPPESVARHRRT